MQADYKIQLEELEHKNLGLCDLLN